MTSISVMADAILGSSRKAVRSKAVALLGASALLLGLVGVTSTAVTAPATAAPAAALNTLAVNVESARTVNTKPGFVHKGDAVTKYSYTLQKVEAGNPTDSAYNCLPNGKAPGAHDPNYPANCQWPGTRNSNTGDPIISTGTEADIAAGLGINDSSGHPLLHQDGTRVMPDGNYLISVKADGYEIGGGHFSVPLYAPVKVALQPYPLPLATIRVRVFADTVPVDSTYEIDAESGLAGFRGYLNDMLGDLSTDYYGNPICTVYQHSAPDALHPDGQIIFIDGTPQIDPKSTGQCISDAQGDIVIPNMAPGRYGIVIRQPADKLNWVQTTTLEGAQDHDWWVMAGDTGYGTETTAGGELVPEVQFGFVPPVDTIGKAWSQNRAGAWIYRNDNSVAGAIGTTGGITGSIHEGCTYIASVGGAYVPNSVPGSNGTADCGPVKNPQIAISGLDVGDQEVWSGQGDVNGNYTVTGLADGNYTVTAWDKPINHILETFNITVTNGEVINAGVTYLSPWFTHITGSVFVDTNGNGRRDPGEQGIVRTNLTFRERDNTPFDQFTNSINTDANGNYDIIQSYPLSRFALLEHADPRYKPTGITVQGCNEKKSTTYLGGAVDISVLPVIGLCGRIDWAVEPYASGETGGIVGTVSYGTTRNELDPADAATEAWQPGIQDVKVNLYATVTDPATGKPEVDPVTGALVKGVKLADTYPSESYNRPSGCTARDRTGAVLTGEQVLPEAGNPNFQCVEAPLAGFQAKPSDATPGASAQTVNGNYGFSSAKYNQFPVGDPQNPAPNHDLALGADLAAAGYPEQTLMGSYIVSIEVPKDSYGKDMYQVTKEEDVNIFSGDDMLPQANFPLTTPTIPGGPPPGTPDGAGTKVGLGVIASCVGPDHTVHVTNPDFAAAGGSPYEGQKRPLCTDKLVDVVNATQQVTNFELFTDVPIATHFWGLILNDLGVSSDPTTIQYGEVEGLKNNPTGIYDWAGNLIDTAISDPNGFYEAVEPSTTRINNPSPTGVSPGVYRFVGNDPGTAGHLNPGYDPRYRTIATDFQAWPGLWTVTDTAPTLTAAQTFNGQMTAVKCTVSTAEPQVFAVDHPVTTGATNVTITGRDFGATQGNGAVLIGGANNAAVDPTTATPLTVSSWGDGQITVTVPAGGAGLTPGKHSIVVRADNGKVSATGITLHVTGPGYNPQVIEVGPGRAINTDDPKYGGDPNSPTYLGPHALQDALDQAAAIESASPTHTAQVLVVAYPQTPTTDPAAPLPNPTGAYIENVVIHSGVEVQGVGPGGFQSDGTYVAGSIIDGSNFAEGSTSGNNWLNTVGSINYVNATLTLPDSATVTVLAPSYQRNGRSGTSPVLDGFTITGGIQSTTPTNINILTGGSTTPYGGVGAVVTQGGGVYVHGGTNGLVVSNNKIDGNSGTYAGAIRVGTPYANGNIGITANNLGLTDTGATPSTSYTVVNQGLVVAHNTITNNGGANLGGGVGLFSGTVGYRVAYNDVCGNFSAEYGGGISHYGFSRQSRIDHNRVWYNESYDEGGGIMVAGEVPPTPADLSGGAGEVTVDNNKIDQNLANDDGGGLRLLNAGVRAITIENNEVVNNVSAHEGGGIALNDSTQVTIDNNTVAKNITTATAITSNGQPAAAGLATSGLSDQIQALNAALGRPAVNYTNPVAFNNVFWDNRAGTFDGANITGIGDAPADTPVVWDIGSQDSTGLVSLTNSVLTGSSYDASTVVSSPTNKVGADPAFTKSYTVSVHADARRSFTAFRQTVISDMTVSPWNNSDYSLTSGSTAAIDRGRAAGAPAADITGFARVAAPDAGAYEFFATPHAAPGTPRAVSNVAGNHQVTVGWTAPVNVGSPSLTGYVVSLWSAGTGGTLLGQAVVPAGTLTSTFTGLTNGTAYYADVVAYNAAGTSAATGRVGATPFAPKPNPPQNVSAAATAQIGALAVSWTAPVGNGGNPLTSYTAYAYTAASGGSSVGSCTTANGTTLTCTITGLAAGAYYVDVKATNPDGASTNAPAPIRFGPVSPSAVSVPGSPTGVGLQAGRNAVKVTWSAPASNGGSPLTGYTVQAYRCTGIVFGTTCLGGTFSNRTGGAGSALLPGCTANAATLTCTVRTLTNGTSYWFWVTAANAVGTSVIPTFTTATLFPPRAGNPPVGPAVPTAAGLVLAVAPNTGPAGRLVVTWTPTTKAAPATTWTVRVYASRTSTTVVRTCSASGASARCTVSGLVPHRTYYVSVTPAKASAAAVKAAVRVKGRAR